MKYLKYFENIKNEPQVDDYVLISTIAADDNVKRFINNTIGQITYIQPDILIDGINGVGMVSVQYENIPKNIQRWFGIGSDIRQFMKNQIVAFGKTKEDVEQKVLNNKFNI